MKDPFRYLDNKKRASMELILTAEDEKRLEQLKRLIEFSLVDEIRTNEITIATYEVMDNE